MAIYDVNGTAITQASSSIAGKTVIFIGDSNTDYNRVDIANALDDLGATYYSNALAGYAWEDTNLANDKTLTNNCGIGQVNTAISHFCGQNNYFPDDCIVIFMLGTNHYGSLGTWDDTAVNTVRGACDYCLSKIAFYARTIPVGVILPWCGYDNAELKTRAQYYGFPVIDLETEVRIIPDSKTSEFGANAYLGGGGNHFEANGKKHFLRIIMNWIQRI